MINKLQQLKGKTKLKFYKKMNNYYNDMKNKNFQTQQDPFAENAQGISKIYHEVLKLMKFSQTIQTKPQVKNMNINYYDWYYAVIKKTKEKENVDNQYGNDFVSLNDVNIPNYVGIKTRGK